MMMEDTMELEKWWDEFDVYARGSGLNPTACDLALALTGLRCGLTPGAVVAALRQVHSDRGCR